MYVERTHGRCGNAESAHQLLLTGHRPVERHIEDRSEDVVRLLATGVRSPAQQARANEAIRHVAAGAIQSYLRGAGSRTNPNTPSSGRKQPAPRKNPKSTAALKARIAEVQERLDRDRWREKPEASTIVHEIGHALVAYALCGSRAIDSAGCWALDEPDDDGRLGGVFVNSSVVSDPIDRIALLLGGAIAEQEVLAADFDVRGTDRTHAVEVVRNAEGWTDDPENTTTWRRGLSRARRVIRSNRGLLNTLAGHLSLEGVLPRSEILRVIGGKVASA